MTKMIDKDKTFNLSPTNNKKSIKGSFDMIGEINKKIGTGKNAEHSIIYSVLQWAFISAVIITFFVVINYWFFRDCENKVPDITSDLRIIWEIVTPIITLALGYEFGKSEK